MAVQFIRRAARDDSLRSAMSSKFEPSPDKENKYEKAKRSKRNSAERAKLRRKADAGEDARFRAAEAARLKQHRAMQWIQQRIQQ